MERELKLYAYAPSVNECEKHNEKFPSLAAKKVTKEAKKDGAFASNEKDYDGNGYFYSRTAADNSDYGIWYVTEGGAVCRIYSLSKPAGACFGISVVYDPESKLVRNAIKSDFSRTIYNDHKCIRENIINKNVPIVIFNNLKYIWYNQEECESGENPLMDLVILDMPERAIQNDRRTNDYATAAEQHEQYKRIAIEGASEEEKKLLVLMSFSPADGYEKPTPIYTEEQKEIIDRVRKFCSYENRKVRDIFERFRAGKINPMQMKIELFQLTQSVRERVEEFSKEEIDILHATIEDETEKTNQFIEEKRKRERETKAKINVINSLEQNIDAIEFGEKEND